MKVTLTLQQLVFSENLFALLRNIATYKNEKLAVKIFFAKLIKELESQAEANFKILSEHEGCKKELNDDGTESGRFSFSQELMKEMSETVITLDIEKLNASAIGENSEISTVDLLALSDFIEL